MKISIITVSYNSVKTIKDTIDTVLNQSYSNVQHLVIDGKSTDGTTKILEKYCKPNFFFRSEPDKGIYHAMNKGLKQATGEVIGFLNADDFYANNQVLDDVVKIFKKDPLIDACYSDLLYVNPVNTDQIVRCWKSSQFKAGLFSKGWCPPHPTFFARRYIYERYGNFNTNYQMGIDVELMMRFLEVFKIKVRHIPKYWVKMRIGGISNKNLKNIFFQNRQIILALNNHGLPVNYFIFFFNKIFSRLKQFIKKT
jgi:glycosyltransferase involved in cell wall biosynthesis